ncbi:putative cystathionine gamma-lyase 2 [Amphiura filiformis]|uniref:putative cystathionine gamma-lyase 2 n=1 Tax=Amphiura filiformis TaxID=82378 RepID=UPI003B21A2E9
MNTLKLFKYCSILPYFNTANPLYSTSQTIKRYLHTSKNIMAAKRQRVENGNGVNFVNGDDTSGDSTFPHFATDAIHAGQDPKRWKSLAVTPLICMSSTFAQDKPGNCPGGFDYSRGGNPTRACLEECVAALEGAKYALAFGSGLAATQVVCQLLKAGEHIVTMDDLYGGTNRLFRRIIENLGITATFVDMTNLENLKKAIQPNTKLVWIETPTNPLLKLVDIQAASDIAHNANQDIVVAVDNTFSSPYFQRPLTFGADLVVHSATKYINGHSDVVMGLVAVDNEEIYKRLQFTQFAGGAVPSPFDCFLCNRGIKTLHVRMRQHMKNGLALARFLEKNPRVRSVSHPGLPSHPQYELALRQMKGYSGMLTFKHIGDLEESEKFLQSLKVFTLAESLGGFESLAELPGVMTHASVPEEQRKVLGIDNSLIRLSVGLEDVEDLIADLDKSLKAAIPDTML